MQKKSDLAIRCVMSTLSLSMVVLLLILANVHFLRWLSACALAALAGIALWEYFQMVRKKELFPAVWIGVTTVVVYLIMVFGKTQTDVPLVTQMWPFFVLALSFLLVFLYYIWVGSSPILHISTSYFGIIYIGVPLSILFEIIYYPAIGFTRFFGTWWVVYVILVTKSADIGGYFVGGKFGKKKLAQTISPNKTVEGCIGGLIASIVVSFLIIWFGHQFTNAFDFCSYWTAIWLGGVLGAIGQIGDLAESFLKRDAGVKDSNILPGVGGVLDIVDSLLFSVPALFIFLQFFYPAL